jgi:hypothetical protein
MNSYIKLILDTEGAKERLQRLSQSALEPGAQSAAVFSIADIEAEQIERTSPRYSHGLIRRSARKLVR